MGNYKSDTTGNNNTGRVEKIKLGSSGLGLSAILNSVMNIQKTNDAAVDINDESDEDSVIDFGDKVEDTELESDYNKSVSAEDDLNGNEYIDSDICDTLDDTNTELDCDSEDEVDESTVIAAEDEIINTGTRHTEFRLKDFETTNFNSSDRINALLVNNATARIYTSVVKNSIYGLCRCRLHYGLLTKQLMDQHDCIGKGCRHFVKSNNGYWRNYEKNKLAKEANKNIEKQKEETLNEIEEVGKKMRYIFNMIISRLHLPMFVISVNRNVEDGVFTIRYVDINRDLRLGEISEVITEFRRFLLGSGVSFELKAIATPDGRLADRYDFKFITDELLSKINNDANRVHDDYIKRCLDGHIDKSDTLLKKYKAYDAPVRKTTISRVAKPTVSTDIKEETSASSVASDRQRIVDTENAANKMANELYRRLSSGERVFYNLKSDNARSQVEADVADKVSAYLGKDRRYAVARAVINARDKSLATIYYVYNKDSELYDVDKMPEKFGLVAFGVTKLKFVRLKFDKDTFVTHNAYRRYIKHRDEEHKQERK